MILLLQSAPKLHHSFGIRVKDMSDEMLVIYWSWSVDPLVRQVFLHALKCCVSPLKHGPRTESRWERTHTHSDGVCSIIWTRSCPLCSHYVIKLSQSKDKPVFTLASVCADAGGCVSAESPWSPGAAHLFNPQPTLCLFPTGNESFHRWSLLLEEESN